VDNELEHLKSVLKQTQSEVAKVVIGQEEAVRLALITIFTGHHALIEGVPGIAKTLLVRTLARVLGSEFSRIQFTPDLMPADITGTNIYNMKDGTFSLVKGPVFTSFLLADEINRAPAKVQSALLEVMQEKQVTIGDESFRVEQPFLVLATQNPIEQEGTYPLPEAQLDRFMFNVWLDYPKLEEELMIVKQTTSDYHSDLQVVLSNEEILFFQDLILRIPIADNVLEYAVKLATKTRPHHTQPDNSLSGSEQSPLNDQQSPDTYHPITKYISWGAGPRASQFLVKGAKCNALINGKYSPDIEDIKAVAKPILRHRIIRNYKAEAEGVSVEYIIDELLK